MAAMARDELPRRSDAPERERSAECLLADMFKKAGWQVRPHSVNDEARHDLVVRRKGIEYVVEIKAAPEGRADRLVPVFAQAMLEAAHAARQKAAPLAVVAAPRVSRRAAEQVMAFAQRYAPD